MINIYYEARTMYYQTIHNSQDLHLPLEWSLILTVTTNYLDNSSRMIVSIYEHMFISKDMIIFEDKCFKILKLWIRKTKGILKATSKQMHRHQHRTIYDLLSSQILNSN